MKDRSVEILRTIINSYIPLSFNYLSEEFEVSTRTIRNEIDQINDFLLSNGFCTVNNIRSEGLVLRLSKSEELKLENLLNSYVDYFSREERILDILLSTALDSKPTFLYQKQDYYLVSKSTVDDDMRNIRSMLEDYNIEIISIPKKGLVLQGKERAIRTMLYSVINKFSDGLNYFNNLESNFTLILNKYITKEDYKIVEGIFNKKIPNTLEELYRKNSIILLCIWIKRNQLGHRVASEDINSKSHLVVSSKNLHKLVEEIKTVYKLDLPEEELNDIVFVLQSLINIDKGRNVDWVQSQMNTIQLISFVEDYSGIPFSRKESLLQTGIYNHIKSMTLRLENSIHLNNPLTATIKKSYGEIFDGVKEYFKTLNTEPYNSITEDEIAYLTIHFSAALSVINQENKYWYRAVVICNHGVATGKLLAEKLKELFSIEVIGVFSSREIKIIKKLDVDLVFSTVDINIDFLPNLKVDPIITENIKIVIDQFLLLNKDKRRLRTMDNDYTTMFQEIVRLISSVEMNSEEKYYEKLEKIFHNNKLHLNKRELQPMIKDILLDTDIQVMIEADNWEESIIKVSQPLLERDVITEGYIKAMIESVKEFGPYIVLAPHFALAHARPSDGVNEIGLSIATLKEGVDFGNPDNDPVTVIFCLSAVDSHSHLNIMKEIINLINDPEKIKRLENATNVQDFKKILLNEGVEKYG